MDSSILTEWLNLALRWAHLIAGISWIGNSFYFMWLDSHLTKPEPPNEKVEGSLWMVHSGGFYTVERRKIFPGEMPKVLHWFKWEATLTWVTGFFLLGLIYYMTNGLYLLDPNITKWSAGAAVLISLGLLVGSWFYYDILMQTAIGKSKTLSLPLFFITLASMSFWLCHNISGRAAFIQIGATMGTIMVLNVWVRILPAQSKMIAATERGELPNYDLSKNAKARSTHNSYMTLPVLFMMVSNHYPHIFANPKNWILILLLCFVGAGFRYMMLGGRQARWAALPVTIAVATMIWMTAHKTVMVGNAPTDLNSDPYMAIAHNPQVDFSKVVAIVQARCISCHSENPPVVSGEPAFGPSPGGVSFDDPENIKRMSARIYERVVLTKTMPLANKTKITDDERVLIGRWHEQGGGNH